jgi:hypothetical protein
MAISRFQMNRQLRAYGGLMGDDGRKAYGIGSFFQKKIMDPIKKVVKSPAGLAAAAVAANYAPKFSPGGSNQTLLQRFLPSVSNALGTVRESIGSGLGTAKDVVTDTLGKEIGSGENKSTIGGKLLSGILSPQALAIGSGLLAGAFTKDEEDPLYTGQDVGLNLQDIAKLANITDPLAGQAIGLRFLPDVEARKFTPEEMAASFAANAPQDFTEKREQAQDGGMMGDQKDFEEFLQDMQDRDKSMLQDRILQDFEKFMKRKRMIEQMPEAKDGGIMKMKDGGLTKYEISSLKGLGYDTKGGTVLEPFGGLKVLRDILKVNKMAEGGIASMAEGGMMDMGGMEMDLRGGGFVPMGRAEKADDVPARLSKNEFVFTADAVRAAGGGDVDKGADKMYATMKKLEDRVA